MTSGNAIKALEMPSGEFKAQASKLKGTVIALVNPRLHSLRHPLLLAVVVVALSLPLVIALIVIGLQDCLEECSMVPMSETTAYGGTCKTVSRTIPDVEAKLSPAFSYIAKDSKYSIVETHEGNGFRSKPDITRSTIEKALNEQSAKQGWGITFQDPSGRLIPYAMDGIFSKANILKGLQFVSPSAAVLADPTRHSFERISGPTKDDREENTFSWEFTYDVDESTVNSEQTWVKGEAGPAPNQPLRPDGDMIATKGPMSNQYPFEYTNQIEENFLYEYNEKDYDEYMAQKYQNGEFVYPSNSTKASRMFLQKLTVLHKKYGVASKVSSERVKMPVEQSAILKKMKIQLTRDDPMLLVPYAYGESSIEQKIPFFERNSRELVGRNVGKDMRRKLKVCWLYKDETQVCLSFKVDDFATQIASSTCTDDYRYDFKQVLYAFKAPTEAWAKQIKTCLHASSQDCKEKLAEDCIPTPNKRGFNDRLHEVVTTPVPWFFERTWNYSTPLLTHRAKTNCGTGSGNEVCPLRTLCKEYPFAPGIRLKYGPNDPTHPGNVETNDEAFVFTDIFEDDESWGYSITNPFPNVCEMHMYLNQTGNNVKFTTVDDLEKMHQTINKLTDVQKFEYQIAQYSGAIHNVLQSKEYTTLAALQADTVTTYCCQKVCPGITTAVGAALGYTSYIELFVTLIVLLCYQFIFGGGYADGEGPEKQTMAAKLKLALAIATEEEKDEENAKSGGVTK